MLLCMLVSCRRLYDWSMALEKDLGMKRAVDAAIATICHIKKDYFHALLQKFFVSPLPASNQTEILRASVSDDAKDDVQQGKKLLLIN